MAVTRRLVLGRAALGALRLTHLPTPGAAGVILVCRKSSLNSPAFTPMHFQKRPSPPQLAIFQPETDLKGRYHAMHQEMLDQLERGMAVENYWLIFLLLGCEL